MARIAGINLPTNKRVLIALTYIHGIGKVTSKNICDSAGVDVSKRVNELSEQEVASIRQHIDGDVMVCLLYTSPSPRDRTRSRMPSSA